MSRHTLTDCVLHAHNGDGAIWHVNTGQDIGMSRMTGAWTFAEDNVDRVSTLVGKRRVLATSSGYEVLERLGVTIVGRIDPRTTIDNLNNACEELQTAYDAHPNRKNLVAPDWPALPRQLDALIPAGEAPEEPAAVTLRMARWLEQVATTWDKIERIRISRKYMPGERTRRQTPVATVQAAEL